MLNRQVTLFFDVGDTLIHPRAPLHALYADGISRIRDWPVDATGLKKAMEESTARLQLELDGHFRYSDGWFERYIRSLLDAIGCPRPWNGIHESLLQLFDDPETFEVFPDAWTCLEAVKALGLQTAIISNWGFRLAPLLDRLKLLSYFDLCISSAEVRKEKPDPEIFGLALKRLGCRPDGTVHIGDCTENDVAGAKSAGLHAVLVDRGKKNVAASETVSSLEELIPHLEARGLFHTVA